MEKYGLTIPQKNIYYVEQIHEKSNINLIMGVLSINKDFYFDICIKVLILMCNIFDNFKIRIGRNNNEVYQYFEKNIDTGFKCLEIYDKEELDKYIKKQSNIPISIEGKLYNISIVKTGDDKGIMVIKLHHLISDAWTFSLIGKFLTENYDKLLNNEELDYFNAPSYMNFLNSEKEYLSSERYEKDKLYWREYLKDINTSTDFKSDYVESNISKRYSVLLSKKENDRIKKYCDKNKVSMYNLFLGALVTYLYRTTNNNDIIIGTPTLNRSSKQRKIMGMFISSMPIRTKIEQDMLFLDIVKNIGRDSMKCFRHQKFPMYENIKEYRRTNKNSNLYNILFSYQNAKVDSFNTDRFSTEWYPNGYIANKLEIHMLDTESTGQLTINYDYLFNLFDEVEIEYIHSRLMNIINNGLKDEEVDVDTIDIMTDKEKDIILNTFNNTKTYYFKDKTVIDLFEEQVNLNPNNVAIVFENESLTYKELNERTNQLSYYIRENVKENSTIAVCMNRSLDLICTLIAVLKCNCTYIPIDVDYPEDRIKHILENSNVKFVITNDDIIINSNYNVLKIKDINFVDFKKSNLKLKKESEQLAYIMYTSGSTGSPKGVMINNQNLVNFLLGINKEVKMNTESIIASVTTISFDIFGLELWLTLTNGGKMILANEFEQIDSKALNNLCLKNNVNIIQTTPTKLKLLMALGYVDYIKNMKKILLGGEGLPEKFITKLKTVTKAEIIDVYGPTETTIWSTLKNITHEENVLAGKPIQNTSILILDNKRRLLPIGVIGEVSISGDSVSPGYYNNETRTKKSFIDTDYYNGKTYLTGDLGEINFNGDLKILGRTDFQVKINGQRIELEDIEQNILKYSENLESVVVLKKDQRLVCFYVTKNSEVKINEDDLNMFLNSKLPSYMIPALYQEINEIPINNSGKVDRKKMLEINIDLKKEDLVMPKNELQKIISDVWSDVLEIENIGINQQFSMLGGDSLSAIDIQIELREKGVQIGLKAIKSYTTIESLSDSIIAKSEEKEFSILGYNKDFSNILDTNKIIKTGKKEEVGNVLITGVTGFLGAHTLAKFIDSEKGIAYCLIRSKNGRSSKQRLISILNFYFGDKYHNLVDKRIFTLEGDISKKRLFDEKNIGPISKRIDFVIHSAACVKHYGDKKYFIDTNIMGTQNVANYCLENGKKLIHISTLSVSGNAFESANIKQEETFNNIEFDETCFYKGQSVDNVYVYTKFKSEEIVLDSINKGLEANIIRLGNLTGRYSDLKFQPNVNDNAFANRIKSIVSLGKIPESLTNMYIEFTPIDLVSEFMVKVMQFFNSNNNMFHAFNHNHIDIKDFVGFANKIGIKIDVVSDKEFSKYITSILKTENKKELLSGIINDLNSDNVLEYFNRVKIKSELTIDYMKGIGFEWKEITEEYVIEYLKYLINIGFIEI